MIARAFIPEGAFDQDEARRVIYRRELASRGDADHEPASRSEQLFGHEYGERRTYRPAYDAVRHVLLCVIIQTSVVACPVRVFFGAARLLQVPDDIAVRVKLADLWDPSGG